MWLFPQNKARAQEQYEHLPQQVSQARAIYDVMSGSLIDVDSFEATAAQLNATLRRMQNRADAERKATQQEKYNLEMRWLQRLRSSRLESSLLAGCAACDTFCSGQALKRWGAVVRTMWTEENEERQGRESALQIRLRDTGRSEVLQEREALLKSVSDGKLGNQKLRAQLDARSQARVRRQTLSESNITHAKRSHLNSAPPAAPGKL